jgi:hypothetical protein
VLEKQGQFELALGFSSQGFELPQLQELEEGTFRSMERGGEGRSLRVCKGEDLEHVQRLGP